MLKLSLFLVIILCLTGIFFEVQANMKRMYVPKCIVVDTAPPILPEGTKGTVLLECDADAFSYIHENEVYAVMGDNLVKMKNVSGTDILN